MNEEFGLEYWFKFRDSIYEVGKPSFSNVDAVSQQAPL